METYKLKYVPFFNREVPVVLQSENGPCPLLAIANVLLLRDAIHLPSNTYEIEQDKLLAILAEYLLDNNPVESNSQYAENLRQNLQDVISNMHKLTTGVDVNPKFSSIRGFEYTNEIAIFDLFDISLIHGWIVDPKESASEVMNKMSYNEVIGKLISNLGTGHSTESPLIDLDTVVEDTSQKLPIPQSLKCDLVFEDGKIQLQFESVEWQKTGPSKPPPPEEQPPTSSTSEQKQKKQWEIVRDWMDRNSSQLSVYGLMQLMHHLPEGELAVFFRNNHFSTIFKLNRSLYLLVTDQGYLAETELVWERLESVNNDNQFYTGTFKIFERIEPREPPPSSDHDLEVALAMSMDNNNAQSSTLPSDFLSLPTQQEQLDSDLAYALQLQDEEQRSTEYTASGAVTRQPTYPSGRGRYTASNQSSSGMPLNPHPSYTRSGYMPLSNGWNSTSRQLPTSGTIPLSSTETPPPSESVWKRLFKKVWSFDGKRETS